MNGNELTRLDVAVRAFTERIDKPDLDRKFYSDDPPASRWSLIFDTETTTDHRQAFRFGCYQLRQADMLQEAGVFYDPEELTKSEVAILRRFAEGNSLEAMTLREFLDRVFLGLAYDLGAAYIGLNLPFDLSRMAIGHTKAGPSKRSHAMVGGFSFRYSDDDRKPKVQVRHLNSRCALIRFAIPKQPQQTPGGMRRRGIRSADRRGHFIDLRSFSAALLSGSWSLASLADFLATEHRKLETEEHGRITPEYLEYACQDVQVTWECYVELAQRYKVLELKTRPERIISEASLGKAYLDQMGVKPWLELQPCFSRKVLGATMSSYYGGRAEVHARRTPVRVAYCDFLSMYPTVCVLMHLWSFVMAKGIKVKGASTWATEFLDRVSLEDMQDPDTWRRLTVLVRVLPDGDIFPVRAKYDGRNRSIGLNRLTRDEPMWFTLADCIASKLLTGKAPKVVEAIAFRPEEPQPGLGPIRVAGNPDYLVHPLESDFFKTVIELRRSTKDRMRKADPSERTRLRSEEQQLKICANATSYGIFVELNPNTHGRRVRQLCYGNPDEAFEVATTTVEEPGRFFNPILGTLITGAARLMLALCESVAEKQGLTWAFCDTDGIALTPGPSFEADRLVPAVESVREWFDGLSPYDGRPSILKLEDENFRLEDGKQTSEHQPLYCLAISAKRYALYNTLEDGTIVLRKATAHGLGHLVAPYEDDEAPDWLPAPIMDIRKLGLKRWHCDLWQVMIAAAFGENPARVDLSKLPGFDRPAASRYAATTPELLDWFSTFNESKDYRSQIRPFGFMYSFQPRQDLPTDEAPRASAPFHREPLEAATSCFDRVTNEPIRGDQLRTIGEALVRFHLHPESKFHGGDFLDRGFTERRHVRVLKIDHIGKESNRWEESVAVGELMAEELDYGECPTEYRHRLDQLISECQGISRRRLAYFSTVSLSEVQRVISREVTPTPEVLDKLVATIERLS